MNDFHYAPWHAPGDLASLRLCLKNKTNDSRFMAGGTDLIVKLKQQPAPADMLIYLGAVPELRQIIVEDTAIRVGAAVTHGELARSAVIQERLPILSKAAGRIGSVQIRNRGTIGGNIASATPANDLLTVLFALDALVETMDSQGGYRSVPMHDFILDIGRTALKVDEVITAFRISLCPYCVGNYVKLGQRSQVSIAQLTGAYLAQTEHRRISGIRLYLGTIGRQPVSLAAAEQLFIGSPIGEPLAEPIIRQCIRLYAEYIKQNVPPEFDRDYKLRAVKGLFYDLFAVN